jgi:hypothetical protein
MIRKRRRKGKRRKEEIPVAVVPCLQEFCELKLYLNNFFLQ